MRSAHASRASHCICNMISRNRAFSFKKGDRGFHELGFPRCQHSCQQLFGLFPGRLSLFFRE